MINCYVVKAKEMRGHELKCYFHNFWDRCGPTQTVLCSCFCLLKIKVKPIRKNVKSFAPKFPFSSGNTFNFQTIYEREKVGPCEGPGCGCGM